jgi:glycosyltransferase involved in cell wall biosynthesis
MSKKVIILIPAYNEAKVIAEVIADIKKKGYKHILVVDDGSSDGTYQVAKTAGAVAVRHFLNRGKGAAIKTGLEAAKLLHADIVVTIDGDGQHDPAEIKTLTAELDKGKDIVLGSRSFNSGAMPLFNRLANRFGNIITWLIYGLWVNDSQSGFRAFSHKALHTLNTSSDRYDYDSEVIQQIAQHKLSFIEVPISVRYTEYSKNKKTKQSFTNGVKTVFSLLRK